MRAQIRIDVLRTEFGIARPVDRPVRVVANDTRFGGLRNGGQSSDD